MNYYTFAEDNLKRKAMKKLLLFVMTAMLVVAVPTSAQQNKMTKKHSMAQRTKTTSKENNEITKLLKKWEGYIQQYRKEIDELIECGGRGIPGMFIYEEEEKCFNQLSGMTNKMSVRQKVKYDELNTICKNELSEYLPRYNR